MLIESALITDIYALTNLYQALIREMTTLQPDNYNPQYTLSFDEWQAMLNNSNQQLFVAREAPGQKVVGFAHVTTARTSESDLFITHHFAYLTSLYVEPAARRLHTGTALVQATKTWQEKQQLAYLELNVLGNNQAAIQFYQHLQFKPQNLTLRLN